MTRPWSATALGALIALTLPSLRVEAGVLFQSTGTQVGWTSVGIQHKGKVEEVTSPTYKGPTALRMEQTFEGLSGYHSEVRLHEAQGPAGSDAYYGMAFYLPPNWIFHPQNVTFQQWARGDVFATPWVLMYVENDEIKVGGSGGVRGVIAKITGKQGRWIRVVTHIHHDPNNGLFEVWVDGQKGLTKTGAVSPAATAPIRWSVGMYCTRWRAEPPRGLDPMVLFHDHQRVATTREEADPASWTDGDGSGPPADAGASAQVDAGPGPDAAVAVHDAGARSIDSPPAHDPAPDGGRRVGDAPHDPRPRDAAAAPVHEEQPPAAKASAPGGGCRFVHGGRQGRSSWALLGVTLLALLRRRRKRPKECAGAAATGR